MPIYYSLVNEFTIDPLYNLDKGRHIVGNHMDLEHVLGLPLARKFKKKFQAMLNKSIAHLMLIF